MNTLTDSLVVAIGPDGHEAALQFAVAEARRSGCAVHLLHVLELPAGDAYVGVYGGALDSAKKVLDDALSRAEELAVEDVAVTGELIDSGWVVEDLVRRSEGASLLVMQHRALSRVQRVFTRSIVHGVAGRSLVPVISVPEGWTPDREPQGVVTAGVQDPVEAPALLRAGFEEARTRAADLVVLHAWWLASGFDVVVVDKAVRDEWAARGHEELQPVLAPLREEFPDVQVTVHVQHAPVIEAVLDAAEVSDVLVLGRRHHLLPARSHLGPVARAALDHATCPVLITPELALAARQAGAGARHGAQGFVVPTY